MTQEKQNTELEAVNEETETKPVETPSEEEQAARMKAAAEQIRKEIYAEMHKDDPPPAVESKEKIMEIPLSEVDPFPGHPFQVKKDEALAELVESIKVHGVLTPAYVRQLGTMRYEMVSGHRRKLACELAGLQTMPAIVSRHMNRDEATIFMVDANMQREHILPSEKAKAYKMKLEAMKRQGQRNDLTSRQLVGKLEAAEQIGNKAGDCGRQVQRYIRLTELTPELQQMVDEKKIALNPAVELSYLPQEEQVALLDTMELEDCTPSLNQAQRMKRLHQEGRLNKEVIYSILTEEKPNQQEKIKIPRSRIKQFFDEDATEKQIEETIIKALDLLRQRERARSYDMER